MALTNQQATLLSKGIIELCGDVDEAMAAYVRECLPILVATDSPDVQLWITSPGGNIACGLLIFDTLSVYPGRIVGTAIGYAHSMAVAVLQACDLRLATYSAHFLIHDPMMRQLSVRTLASRAKLAREMTESEMYFQRFYEILCEGTGRPMREIRARCRKEREMFPREARSFGLIDRVIRRKKKD